MVCKKPKIRKNPQNFNDFAEICPFEYCMQGMHGMQ